MPIVQMLEWEESERGWGTRPDGLSLHLDVSHAKGFLALLAGRRPAGPVPDCYDRPVSDTPVAVEVSAQIYEEIRQQGGSLRSYDMVMRTSATGARRVVRKGAYDGDSFMHLVAVKKARLSEVDDYIDRWHSGTAGQGAELHEYLGLSSSEYAQFLKRPEVLAELALARALAAKQPEFSRHVKSEGEYLVLGEAKLEGNLAPVCVYMGVDGQLWVRDSAEFRDGRFQPISGVGKPLLSLKVD